MKNTVYIVVLSILFLSCKDVKTAPAAVKSDNLIRITKVQFQSLAMQIGAANEQDFDMTVKATGKIDVPPQNRAKVTTFIGGYVKSTLLLVGDKVKKGQALITLENTEFLDIQKDYLEVAEQINYLKSEYERQKTLYEEKISSQKNYLKAESEYKKAFGMYQSLRNKLSLLHINPNNVEKGKLTSTITIYAPISGDITVVNANLGMLMSPSDVIMEIINNEDLHIELSVFEKDILAVKEEQHIHFLVPEASKEVFNGKVHLIGKSIETNDRTINVHGHLEDNIKQRLLTGMFVEASIIVNSKKGLAIPADALITENNKNYVLLLEDEDANDYFFKKIAVTVGEKSEQYVEIIPDNLVNASSKIVVKGAFEIAN